MTSVYLDANIYIYYFDRNPAFAPQAASLLRRLADPGFILTYSSLCLGEVLVRPIREKDLFTSARINQFFRSPGLAFLAFTPDAARRYAEVRANYKVNSPDALHLATAASAGVDLFLTNDTRLLRLEVPGIGQIVSPSHPL